MILAAGLTPAWQQILQFDHFQTGEVNRASSAMWCASGKVLNVAIALRFLNAPCVGLSFVGGASGDAIRAELSQLDVPMRYVPSNCATRVCTTILDLKTGKTTELVENAHAVTAGELESFRLHFAELASSADHVLLTGSLPMGTPETYFRDLIQLCAGRVILDCRGRELTACLPHRPLLVKPNREELDRTVGRVSTTDDELVSAMRELCHAGAQWVLVTQGNKSVWLVSLSSTFRLTPVTVDTVNPIGCGDCLAAGVAVALAEDSPMVDAVRFGMAAAAENARQLLPARLDRGTVKELAEQIAVVTP